MRIEKISEKFASFSWKVAEQENSAKDHNSAIRNKKRIEAIIPSEKTDSVLST